MGIQGLLTFVKPASKSVHLSDLKGQTVAIDSYCWIHKGAFGCAEKLGKGEDTDAYVQYCFKFIDMLRTFKITPIMVFDGQNLPAKRLTEEKRRATRALARKRAAECLKLNKLGEARMNFIKAVDVTPEMALKLIKACRKQNVDCIVAPYEADAQLAFLNQSGVVDCVITEDSDLLVFGCSKVLFKLDLNGNGTLVESDKLFLTMDEKPGSFTLDKFRYMCILSGCDYLESLPGIGLKKGMKFIKANSNSDIYDALPKLPTSLNLKNVTVTKEYQDNFMVADATFRHQMVFDPLKRQIRPLSDPVEYGTKIEYCINAGDSIDQKVAFQLAIGNLSPDDLTVMDNWNPDKDLLPFAFKPSIWSKSYQKPKDRPKPEIEKPSLPKTKNKNVIIDIKIPLLPTEEEIRHEEHVTEEIHALYFENPSKKICLDKPKSPEKSPVLTRRNIFIKSRFFSEKALERSPQNGSPERKSIQLDEESLKTRSSGRIKRKLGSESPERDILPLNEIEVEPPEVKSSNVDVECDLEVLTSSQKENEDKIARSRFFSVESEDNICNKSDMVEVVEVTEVVEVKNTRGSQGGKHFLRTQSLDERLFNISSQKLAISSKTTSSRRVGLSRKLSATKFTVQKNQTKLSMFFKKT